MRGVFVTGTATEVGKTVATACLAAGLRARGLPVRAIKPLATGGPPPGEDALLLGRVAGHPPLNLLSLPTPCSPERAALQDGSRIDLDAILAGIRALAGEDLVVVEGVGGWRVPLTADRDLADLAAALALPVILVAANRLGVLNHCLLSVDAIRARGLSLAAVILVAPEQETELHGWNAQDLAGRVGAPLLRLPWLPDLQTATLAAAGEALLQRSPAWWARGSGAGHQPG